ncbi:AAA family ATPase [Streptomyces sp. NPDC002994]|uniref:AAA family ATPase n=1 Tax=Streptomyces sp. NPDC002994 TaxID=3154441 RepID=UPI00339F56E8
MGEDGRLARGVVVRRLLAVDQGSGSVSSLHVRVMAEAAGVTARTVWRWLSEARAGRLEPEPRQDRFELNDELWAVLAEVGGNVAALHRRMTGDGSSGSVPSLGTLHRVVQRDLRAGRVLEAARPAHNRVEVGRYDRVLAELKLQRAGEGLPVIDTAPTDPGVAAADADEGLPSRGGVRLFVPGARVVSTGPVAAVVEAVGHTAAARGIGCVFGDPGVGKTVAVQQALHLLPSRVPVWRAVVGVKPGLPQMRASLLEALGLPPRSLSHRAGPADRALGEALRTPGVLFLDDAQRLSPPLLDYLRLLWDEPGTAAALVLCGAGAERVIARAPALRSRVLTWHQVPGLDQDRLTQTLAMFHAVWEGVDPADVGWADATVARGNYRTWAKITSHVYALSKRGQDVRADRSSRSLSGPTPGPVTTTALPRSPCPCATLTTMAARSAPAGCAARPTSSSASGSRLTGRSPTPRSVWNCPSNRCLRLTTPSTSPDPVARCSGSAPIPSATTPTMTSPACASNWASPEPWQRCPSTSAPSTRTTTRTARTSMTS